MTREEMKKLLESPVAKAWAEGKEVEYEPIQNARVIPNDVSPLEIVSTPWKFRIKPQPREWWEIRRLSDGYVVVGNYKSRQDAEGERALCAYKDVEIVHVREALE